MLPTEFDAGMDAPPGASAVLDGDALVLTWPSEADDRRLVMALAGALVGLGAVFRVHTGTQTAYEWVLGLSALAGAGLGVVAARFLPRNHVTLTATKTALRVHDAGSLFGRRVALRPSQVRDLLVIEEQDGKRDDGEPIMVHRLVAVLVDGGRAVLVRRLKRSNHGHWVEACHARWVKQLRG